MATITGLTAARMLGIEANSIISGAIVGNDLILTRQGGATINAGDVRGPVGPSPSLVSTLPGSPTDGQIVHYQSAAMAALGIIWAFRFKQSTNKWEFVGGPPLTGQAAGGTLFAAAVGTWANPHAGSIVDITVPLGGDYWIESSMQILSSAGGIANFSPVLGVGGSGVSPFNVGLSMASGAYYTQFARGVMSAVPAASVIRNRYYINQTTNLTIAGVVMSVLPIKVG